MKKLLLSAFVAFAMLASTKTLAQQGFGTNTPDKSAAVDIVSSKRGLLIPRLALTETTDQAPIPLSIAPATSLFVYNTATVNDVIPGFYYWDGAKWVRFVSSSTEKNVVVTAGKNVEVNSAVSTDGLTTTYTVGVAEGDTNGQVLVTKETSPGVFTSEWVNPDDFIKGVNGINVTTDAAGNTNVGLGGALDKNTNLNTTGFDFAITGLPTLTAVTSEKVMVMDANGILKQVSLSDLLAAKDLTLGDGLNFEASIAGNDGVGAVLKATKIEIGDTSVTSEKLVAATDGSDENKIPVANLDGSVEYKDASTAIGKALTTDNIIGVGADATAASATTANLLNGAVLTPTYLKIKDDAITATQIAENAVTASELADNSVASANIIDGSIANADLGEKSVSANKLTSTVTNAAGVVTSIAPANTVPTADGSGGVTYQTIAAAAGEDLTTDGKIVIGSTNVTTLADAVLVPTRLSIAAESITSADIKNGTITTADIKAPNSSTDNNLDGDENMVMVTDSNGDVTWIAQSSLANKDNYNFTTPLAKDAGTANANGGTDYTVSIATASATTLGVVKQSATTGEEITIATDGSLSINEANVTVGTVAGSDVTGKLNDLTVTGIQGTAVSATAPTAANNMLVYNSTTNQWEPSTVAAAAGKTLTGAGITVTPGANATPGTATSLASTVLADVTLGIANDAITNDKLADDAVKTENIENGAVTNEDLALKAVTADKMESKNIATGTNVAAGMVPTADGSGGVEYKTINNTVAVINGLRKDATAADVIKLGGDLIEATAINTSVGSTGNTLAITGLANVAPATATKNKVIVAETTGGVLRTVDKIVTGTNVEVAANANYSFHTPEVVINVTLGNTDQTITFPSAASAEGQVINIKIANTTEAHTGYLNVLDTYGAMPYQAWIVKSNGTTWEIVGRN